VHVYVRLAFLPIPEQLALAKMSEELGFDGVTVSDHLAFPYIAPGAYPYTDDHELPFPIETPWPDAAVLLGALAATTTTLRFLTSVYLPPLRHPIISAKSIGTASVISQGRIDLGVGVGWMREEFETLAVPYTERGARTDEAIDALRRLWKHGPVEHHGRFWDFGPILTEPVPDPPPPILIGGSSEAARRRAITRGDGYVAPEGSIDEMRAIAVGIRDEVDKAGRDAERFRVYINCTGADVETLCDVAPDIEMAGVMPWPWPGLVSLDEKKHALERFSTDVLRETRNRIGAAS
jgi:probable F420-dependent oxidoreductase